MLVSLRSFFVQPIVRYFLSGILFLLLLEMLWTPKIHAIRYRLPGKNDTSVSSFPILLKKQKAISMDLRFSFDIHAIHGTTFSMQSSGCITHFSINESSLSFPCPTPITIDLGQHLHTGQNIVQVTIEKKPQVSDMSWDFTLPSNDPVLLSIHWSITILFVYLCTLLFHRTIGRKEWAMTLIFSLGVLLRILYVAVTPFTLRGHDADAHLDYLQFLVNHRHLPLGNTGWEMHQPPLYYLLMSPILALAVWLKGSGTWGYYWIQQGSLYLSIASLAATFAIGKILFGQHHERRNLILFLLLCATFPGSIFFASRINNDVLFLLLSFVFLGTLLAWWRDGTVRSVITLSAVLGLGLLTKANADLWFVIFFLALIFRPHTPLRQKLRWLGIAAAFSLVIAGWFFLYHILRGDFSELLRFGMHLNPKLNLTTSWKSFVFFGPETIIRNPFVSPWADAGGRQYFWIYLFKSSLFGEFSFPKLLVISQILEVLGLGLVLLACCGILRLVRTGNTFRVPLLLTFVIVLGGALSYRILHPASSNQDFRFSVLLVPVLGALIVACLSDIRERYRIAAYAWVESFVLCCCIFFSLLTIFR